MVDLISIVIARTGEQNERIAVVNVSEIAAVKIRKKLEIDWEMASFRVRFRKDAQDIGQRLEAVFRSYASPFGAQRLKAKSGRGPEISGSKPSGQVAGVKFIP